MTSDVHRIRVAHVVAGLAAGGVETWLVRLLRNIDRRRFQIDFMTTMEGPGFFDEEVRALGSRIVRCASPERPWRFARSLSQALDEYGPYDVVHSHLHHFSGYVLRVANRCGVPLRIAHSHSDTSRSQVVASLARKMYLRTTEHWIHRHATQGLAVSDAAGAALFPRWRRDSRWRVLHCGIELEPFRTPVDRSAVRARYALPAEGLVLGHIGGFRKPKNHVQLIRIAAEVMAREPRAYLLLVGEGPMRAEVEREIRRLGIAGRVRLAGRVDDALEVLRGAMDVFVFPSLWEGLPLAVVEAQAAGLPCAVSDVIAPEVTVIDSLVVRLSLDAPPGEWAKQILQLHRNAPVEARTQAWQRVGDSSFNILTCTRQLERLYASVETAAAESCAGKTITAREAGTRRL
ncbi:MAG TPA: glycosyltransferase [Gammaproteobacteria bacterium]